MFDVMGDINWWAVALGFVAFTLLGGTWFAVLFPKPYNRSLGRPADAPAVRAPLFFVGPAVCTLAMTVTTAVLLYGIGIDGYGDALLFAVIVGVGYLCATTTTIAINPNFPRPLLYAAISGGYELIGTTIVTLIIVAFR